MQKVFFYFIAFIFTFITLQIIATHSPAQALGPSISCPAPKDYPITGIKSVQFMNKQSQPINRFASKEEFSIKVTFEPSLVMTGQYFVEVSNGLRSTSEKKELKSGETSISLSFPQGIIAAGEYSLTLKINDGWVNDSSCGIGKIEIVDSDIIKAQCAIVMSETNKYGQDITIRAETKAVDNIEYDLAIYPGSISIPQNIIKQKHLPGQTFIFLEDVNTPGMQSITIDKSKLPPGSYTAVLEAYKDLSPAGDNMIVCDAFGFSLLSNTETSTPVCRVGNGATVTITANSSCITARSAQVNAGAPIITNPALPPAVAQLKQSGSGASCTINLNIGLFSVSNAEGVATAIGCFPVAPEHIITALLMLSLSIGGGIAFLLMVFGAFQMITSAGNPDSVKEGQERFQNAIIGLLFIIFSIFIMQLIGATILGIPGFS